MPQHIPSAKDLVREALQRNPNYDINSLHSATYGLMIEYKSRYYETKVDAFLSRFDIADLPNDVRRKLREKMLEPVFAEGVSYSNFMEEASRRISQSFQPVSGKIAELCAQRELVRVGLAEGNHFTIRERRTDITVYWPNVRSFRAKHRIEVKNVSLRERAARGLIFDGDSLFGFFNDVNEFTEANVEVIDDLCEKTNGYCYLPPSTLEMMPHKGRRFRPNTVFGNDMVSFSRTGRITT
jgi:hypothetical protein